ncbi:glycoside hydrolase superfamily [Polychytrium aggregatum]|uniref:glycoside hydrolase superfamily n=1 Tax=Polychytrium aggregatum TaxID=110093 RepID=UPI0022FDDA4E|nr:glycoside hydrolase superfamily [Polychytrium aggregatum]KAI9202128.1 glycoside hydrolase superfamily [Polychytrium aggregatum]
MRLALVSSVLALASFCSAAAVSTPVPKQDFAAYIPNWTDRDYTSINFSNINQVIYAFFQVASNGTVLSTDSSADANLIPVLNGQLRKKYGFKTLASIGGWTASTYFSNAFNDTNRQAFVNSAYDVLIKQLGFDGIDIDWEYPNNYGAGCNVISPDDYSNFNKTLVLLRQKIGSSHPITAAIGATASTYSDGSGKNWIPVYANTLDKINIMTYDYNGNWNPYTDYNTPLYSDASSPNGDVSINQTVTTFVKQLGIPASKLRLGLEFNGHSIALGAPVKGDGVFQLCLPQVDPNNPQACPPIQGDKYDTPAPDPCTGVPTVSGDWSYRGLREQGVLVSKSKAQKPWVRTWHGGKIQAPTLVNTNTSVFITYDDTKSIQQKVKFAKQWNLGVFAWELSEDYYDAAAGIHGELITAAVAEFRK